MLKRDFSATYEQVSSSMRVKSPPDCESWLLVISKTFTRPSMKVVYLSQKHKRQNVLIAVTGDYAQNKNKGAVFKDEDKNESDKMISIDILPGLLIRLRLTKKSTV